MHTALDDLFSTMEVTIGDAQAAVIIVSHALPESQGRIIIAMSLASDLVQVYYKERQKSLWDMTGLDGVIPHAGAVKALIRKKLIVPTTSDREWDVQIALGTADERVWQLNGAIFKPLGKAECLIRSVREALENGKAPEIVER